MLQVLGKPEQLLQSLAPSGPESDRMWGEEQPSGGCRPRGHQGYLEPEDCSPGSSQKAVLSALTSHSLGPESRPAAERGASLPILISQGPSWASPGQVCMWNP